MLDLVLLSFRLCFETHVFYSITLIDPPRDPTFFFLSDTVKRRFFFSFLRIEIVFIYMGVWGGFFWQ